ncbi:MAG: tetratricopeptide repeat protein [Methylobacillus sp.]|jgi:tetratricopeptide (TPR) repeat protein|nr:tetratricopeptide repeat protein [Methylobacillus sp.]
MASTPGRNAPCPCGSGKKFKHCCLNKSANPRVPAPTASPQQQLANALHLAQAHLAQGNWPQAATVCRRIIEHIPQQPDAWHMLGVTELRQGNIERALDHIQRALQQRPDHPEYLGNMGYALHEKGDLAEAEAYYKKTLARAPDYVPTLFNQHALLLTYDREDAIKNLERVLARAPQDNEARFMLAVILEYAHRDDAAQAHLKALEKGNALDRARLDAWNYFKSACNPMPPLTGSMMETFRLAFDAAPQQGLVLEFGVRFGNTIRQLARLTAQKIYGFDSFEGLPEVWHHEPKGSYTTRGEMPDVPPNVTLIPGWFEQTLPEFLATHPEPVRLVNVDCDIYSSTKTVLDALAPRIVAGSVLIFDEYLGNEHWREDEFKAFQETIARHGWKYEYLCFSVYTKQVAVRVVSV